MLIAAAAIIAGIIVLVWSADTFVAGSAAIARHLGMPPILIGLTIVSIGTSAPEVLVSINAALAGAGELAVGNAIGSNLANMGLVLGAAALCFTLPYRRGRLRRELRALLAATFGCGALLLDREIDAWDAALMLAALAFILLWLGYFQYRGQGGDADGDSLPAPLSGGGPGRAWGRFALGLALLIGSSKLLVWGATEAAAALGVSPLIIGLTVVAVGTSLPELAASIASAARGHAAIALGNVLGSNLFNLLGVMSLPGLFGALRLDDAALTRDYGAMTGMTVLLAAGIGLSRRRAEAGDGGGSADGGGDERQKRIGRGFGLLLLSLYGLYYYWLFLSVR